MELHHSKHHAGLRRPAPTPRSSSSPRPATRATSPTSTSSRRTSRSTSAATSTTRSSGPTSSPDGGDKPTGELAAAIDDNFGSFDKFHAHFTAAALGVQGSGWAVLAWDSIGERLIISSSSTSRATLPGRHHAAAACWTCGSTPSTSTTRTSGRLREGVLEHRQLGQRAASASQTAREKTSGLLLLS